MLGIEIIAIPVAWFLVVMTVGITIQAVGGEIKGEELKTAIQLIVVLLVLYLIFS
jgi:hypothetical protein